MLTDLSLAELRDYRPDVPEPADFDDFWERTLAEARAAGGEPTSEPAETVFTTLHAEDVTFPGFAGDPVRAWYLRPAGDEPLPCVVEFLGYGGGRGIVERRPHWASAGFAHLVMDTRGQGSAWGEGGHTPDPHGSGPAFPGVMTRGIESPERYYYRRLMTDAVRAVDYVLARPDVSAAAVTGISQGGGLALAAGALHRDVVAVMPDVPFLCHIRRGTEVTDANPFHEIVSYLAVNRGAAERVFETLSYIDGVNMARRITAPTRMSVALMDATVPPSTVFAAVNAMPTPPELDVYEFNGHEGGELVQWRRQVEWLRDVLGPTASAG